MFKLLTEKEKAKVASEYKIRRAVVMVTAFIAMLIVAMVGLTPSYILSNSREKDVLERTRILENSEHNDNKELETWLKETNIKLKTIDPKLDTDKPSLFVENILSEKGSSIRLTSFSWVRLKGELVLFAEGFATTRQALIEFEDRINATGKFSNVSLPVSNLAQDKNIGFQIKLSPAKKP